MFFFFFLLYVCCRFLSSISSTQFFFWEMSRLRFSTSLDPCYELHRLYSYELFPFPRYLYVYEGIEMFSGSGSVPAFHIYFILHKPFCLLRVHPEGLSGRRNKSIFSSCIVNKSSHVSVRNADASCQWSGCWTLLNRRTRCHPLVSLKRGNKQRVIIISTQKLKHNLYKI